MTVETSASRHLGSEILRLPIESVLLTDSPRLDGTDDAHTRTLAGVEAKLPPIIVHCGSMRVIDGTHRIGAALLRGDDTIEARLFDGSDQDAFLLAVKANLTHGLPLSLDDRMAAAERIIGFRPAWSDRVIAEATGLGTRTIGGIRRRLGSQGGTERIGRDGRVRPLDNTVGRRRAYELIKSRPNASLREIARDAGVSPTTVGDVRDRIRRGEDPIRSTAPRALHGHGASTHPSPAGEPGITTILLGLKKDPALRLTETGRTLLRWVNSRALQPEERQHVVGKVPPHSTYAVAALARCCADEWLRLAAELESRAMA